MKHSIIIFGGARGIGKIIAEYFLKNGHEVTVVGRDKETLNRFKHSNTKKANTVKADVSIEKEVVLAFKAHQKKWAKTPDVVINCAGIQGPIGNSWAVPTSQWEETIKINLLGSYIVTKTAIRQMEKKGRGSIMMFSGGGAVAARPNFSAYGISKSGVLRMVETIAEELRTSGHADIHINAIAPGAVKTGMTAEIIKAGSKAGKQALEEAAKIIENGGTPAEDIINLVNFLIDVKRNKGLTGRLIHVREDYQGLVKKFGNQVPDEIGKIRRIPIK